MVTDAPTPCREEDGYLWTSEFHDDRQSAAALCSDCPLAAECLAGALERQEVFGVWGGVDLSPEVGRRTRAPRAPKPKPKVCQECEQEFTKPKDTSRRDWARAMFCSRKCANRAAGNKRKASAA